MELIGSEQTKTRQPRRTFTKQFKAQLVARVHKGEQSLAKIALDNLINLRPPPQIFDSIQHAQETATRWMWLYNNERSNTAIGGIPPQQKLAMAA